MIYKDYTKYIGALNIEALMAALYFVISRFSDVVQPLRVQLVRQGETFLSFMSHLLV